MRSDSILNVIKAFVDLLHSSLEVLHLDLENFANIRSVLERKLQMLAAAVSLNDLRIPPANGLEALAKDRTGQHSIRVNDQFRLCFCWTREGPADVECVDYH